MPPPTTTFFCIRCELLNTPAFLITTQVDLGLSAYSNAAAHHDLRKRQAVKQAKTLAANEAALKAAEKKTAAQLQKASTDGIVGMCIMR